MHLMLDFRDQIVEHRAPGKTSIESEKLRGHGARVYLMTARVGTSPILGRFVVGMHQMVNLIYDY